jgi:hypothetical protein
MLELAERIEAAVGLQAESSRKTRERMLAKVQRDSMHGIYERWRVGNHSPFDPQFRADLHRSRALADRAW